MKTTIIAVFLLLVVNISYVFAGSCLANPNITSFNIPTRTSRCPHYMADTCCKADFVEGQCVRNDGCRRVPDTCSGYMDLIGCALECKPNMDVYFDGDGNLKVCFGLYDRVVEACKDLTYCPDEDTDCWADSNNCLPRYANESEIWQISVPGYTLASVVRLEGDGICFNTAASLFAQQSVLFALMAVTATLLF